MTPQQRAAQTRQRAQDYAAALGRRLVAQGYQASGESAWTRLRPRAVTVRVADPVGFYCGSQPAYLLRRSQIVSVIYARESGAGPDEPPLPRAAEMVRQIEAARRGMGRLFG